MELTQPFEGLNRSVTGYMVNVALSPENQEIIEQLQQQLKEKFPDTIVTFPKTALHITILDWVAPLVVYEKNHDTLFQEVFNRYDKTLSEVIADEDPIVVIFDTISVSNGAIFITAKDNGQIQRIRNRFVKEVGGLIPNTKKPPTIIHTTVARFQNETNLHPIHEFVDTLSVQFVQTLSEFRLVHEKVMPQLEFDIIKTYSL